MEGDDAAAEQVNDSRLEPFGAIVFQIFFDGSDVSFEIMHVPFEGLVIMFA
jgi:hypothetical protein